MCMWCIITSCIVIINMCINISRVHTIRVLNNHSNICIINIRIDYCYVYYYYVHVAYLL